MAAMRQVHSHHGIPGPNEGEVHRHVRLAARVGLDISVLRAEELFHTVASKVFDIVYYLAAAIVSVSWIPLGVLVGEHAHHGFADSGACDVFAGDKLKVVSLTNLLPVNQFGDAWI